MQTIDIAQAIKDNSANVSQNLDPSVLGGLIETASLTNSGLLSKSLYKITYFSKKFNAGKLVRICSNSGFDLIFSVVTAGCGCAINISSSSTGFNNVKVKLIGETALNYSHFSMYKDSDGVYLYSENNMEIQVFRATRPEFIFLEESTKQTSDLEKLDIV